MKKLRIGLIGFGTVGQAVYQMLQNSSEVNAEVVAIGVKDRAKPRSLPMDRFSFDWHEVVDRSDVDTIVEVTGDVTNAYQLTVAALNAGKPVISANKRMLALNLASLREVAGRTGTPLLYEGSTCAGVPIINVLEKHHAALPLDAITGVFNASSQFVLSAMESGQLSYEEAVRHAQHAGWAEADPTLDMAGFDTTYKLCLLATHGFGTFIKPDSVVRFGVQGVSSSDILWANSFGCRIKVVAHAVREENRLAVWVLPELVPSTSKLFSLDGEEAAVLIEASSFGYHILQGKGAGGFVTGSAILADLKALAAGNSYSYAKTTSGIVADTNSDLTLDVVIRHANAQVLRRLPLQKSETLFGESEWQYTLARVQIAGLHNESFRQQGLFIMHVPSGVLDQIADHRSEPASVRK